MALLSALLAPTSAAAWAARTHRLVTDLAVDLLRGQCRPLFEAERARLMQLSVEPDTVLRQREGRREAIRHYIDLDAYMPHPFPDFPRRYRAAVELAGREQVEGRGVLPWAILRMERRLRAAVTKGNDEEIVLVAGHLSHYVADAHQPLHLTDNHDGQKTGNDGVHKRLEVGVVDDRIEQYESALRGQLTLAWRAPDLRSELFNGFTETYKSIQVIMDSDREASRGAWRHGPLYYRRMDAALRPVIERQLAAASIMLASIWYTACGDAPPP